MRNIRLSVHFKTRPIDQMLCKELYFFQMGIFVILFKFRPAVQKEMPFNFSVIYCDRWISIVRCQRLLQSVFVSGYIIEAMK